MNKVWMQVFSIILFVILLTFAVSMLAARNRLDTQFSGSRFTSFDGAMERAFTPKNNNLNIIIISLKNPGLENTDDFKISLIEENGQTLRTMDFSGRNFGDPGDIRFQFEPIVNSANKKLIVRIEKLETSGSKIVGIQVDKEDNLAFASFHRLIDKKNTARGFVTVWKSNVQDNIFFFVFWAAILSGIYWLSKKE